MNESRWLVKALSQYVLSKIPAGERVNYRLQRQDSENVRLARYSRIVPLAGYIWPLVRELPTEGSVVVDIGTGWDLISSIIFHLLGADKIVACDHLRHARYEAARQVAEGFSANIEAIISITGLDRGLLESRIARILESQSLDELLSTCHISYQAPSLLNKLPVGDGSVDLVYSYAVLAHPPKEVVAEFARETFRVLKKNGTVFHYIGLQDPFANLYSPNSHVRFLTHSETFWNFLVNNSINSNNRLRSTEHIALLEEAGFSIVYADGHIYHSDVTSLNKWKPADRFAGISRENLAMCRLVVRASNSSLIDSSKYQKNGITLVWFD